MQSGRFRVLAELGRGGMASVQLALAEGAGGVSRPVVIKSILPELREDPDIVGMFLDEARLAARLSHPNVVQTTEIFEEDGLFYMVMEYVSGQPLSRLHTRLAGRNQKIPWPITQDILSQLLEGLAHLHEATTAEGRHMRAVHRDVCAQNTLIAYSGQVHLSDFGVAYNECAQVQRIGLLGRLSNMAPEQARGLPVDPRSDLFGVGIILWELALGASPWRGLGRDDLLRRLIQSNAPPDPRDFAADLPPRAAALLQRAVAPDPAQRFQSVAEMIEALRETPAPTADLVPRSAEGLAELMQRTFAVEQRAVERALREGRQARVAERSPTPAAPRRTGPVPTSTPTGGSPIVAPPARLGTVEVTVAALEVALEELRQRLKARGLAMLSSTRQLLCRVGEGPDPLALAEQLVRAAAPLRRVDVQDPLRYLSLDLGDQHLWLRISPRYWWMGWGPERPSQRELWMRTNSLILGLAQQGGAFLDPVRLGICPPRITQIPVQLRRAKAELGSGEAPSEQESDL